MINYFDKIFCINLNSRTDRWEESLCEFDKIGIKEQVERFPACELTPGIAGCTKSHYEIVKLAKQNNYKNILIFEDDITILDNFLEILQKSIKQLEKYEYDLLYLGGNILNDNTVNYKTDENLIKLGYCKTTHAYIINESVYDKIINVYENLDWSNPRYWNSGNKHRMNIDIWLINNIQINQRSYGVYPCLVEQRESYSNLVGTTMYVPMVDKWNNLL